MAQSVTVLGSMNLTNQPLLSRHGRYTHEYYVTKARAALAAGNATKAAFATAQDVIDHQAAVQAKIEDIFGVFPNPRSALNAVTTDTLVRTGYVIEKVHFDSEPGLIISANFYIPDGASGGSPVPCVVLACGHTTTGKAGTTYQTYAQSWAKLGFACLIFDCIGQGERKQYTSNSAVSEHLQMGRQAPLTGRSLAGQMAYDASRAVDYVLSRAEVDSNNILSTGQSGGGTQSVWLTAVDSRITASAPSCFTTEFARNLTNELYADHEQTPNDILLNNFDLDDLLLLRAPKPLVLLGQELDYFDRRGLEAIHARLLSAYTLLGAASNLSLSIGPTDHLLSKENREVAYSFFNLHANGGGALIEPAAAVEAESTLFVAGGNVSNVGSGYLRTVMAAEATAQAAARGTPTGATLLSRIETVMRFPNISRAAPPDYRVHEFYNTFTFTNYPKRYGCVLQVETEPGIIVPLYRHYYDSTWHAPLRDVTPGTRAILYCAHRSADQESIINQRPAPLNAALTTEPNTELFMMDSRISGECKPHLLSTYGEDFLSQHAAMFGETMLGKLVWDTLRCIDLLGSYGYTDIYLIGYWESAIQSALAAALDTRVTKCALTNTLTRFEACAKASPEQQAWTSARLPRDVLQYFDLPDVYAELTSRLGANFTSTSPFGAWLSNPSGEF